jgi:micrococcal nuclease
MSPWRHLASTRLVALAATLCLSSTLFACTGRTQQRDVILGRVIKVTDGDTIVIIDSSSRQHRIRLFGVDSPEAGQDFGNEATENLSNLVFGRDARVEVNGFDRYERALGKVWVGETDVGLEQIKSGYAWLFTRYAHQLTQRDRTAYDRAEASARSARRGLWQDQRPVPPWDYRHPEQAQVSPSPDTQPASSSRSVVIGNRRSRVYHRADCPGYQAVSPQNRIPFDSEREAQAAGYRLAGNCPHAE